MNTANHINLPVIINSYLHNRTYKPVRAKYGVHYKCITVLLSCYLLMITTGKQEAKITAIYDFTGYYTWTLLVRYVNRLVEKNLLSFSGQSYSLTSLGMDAVREVSDNNNKLIYAFSNKYGIEL